MAKELPYFKFEPSEWQNGNVQMLVPSERAMFIDICCVYWQRLGNVPYAFALQKQCSGDASAMQRMIDLEILQQDGVNLVINFLDEQMQEFNLISEKRSTAARSRWSDANALQVQSKSNAIREDKIREDKSKEVSKAKRFTPPTIDEVKSYVLEKGYIVNADKFVNFYESKNWYVGKNKMKDWKAAVRNWNASEDNKITTPKPPTYGY